MREINCYIFQYNLYSFKPFYNQEQLFVFLHQIIVHFIIARKLCSTGKWFVCWGKARKWKSEGAKSELLGGCSSCSQPKWLMVSLFLLQFEALHFQSKTQRQLTLEQLRSLTSLWAVLRYILSFSEIIFIVTLLSVKMSAETESTMSGVLAGIVGFSGLSSLEYNFDVLLNNSSHLQTIFH